MTPSKRPRAFTLIELLIVVAIIAILAAIAVPNFLEAQTRAKVSRAKADIRTVATGLETYRVDTNRYPPNHAFFGVDRVGFSSLPPELSTPIAYLTNARLYDPFKEKDRDPVHAETVKYLTYMHFVNEDQWQAEGAAQRATPPEAVDAPGFNVGVRDRWGYWQVLSLGPDRRYSNATLFPGAAPVYGADVAYDPTNGTISFGNVYRTQRTTDGTR